MSVVCKVDKNDYYSGHRVGPLVRLVALMHHDGRVGGLIPGLGHYNTTTMTPNIVFSGLQSPSSFFRLVHSRYDCCKKCMRFAGK